MRDALGSPSGLFISAAGGCRDPQRARTLMQAAPRRNSTWHTLAPYIREDPCLTQRLLTGPHKLAKFYPGFSPANVIAPPAGSHRRWLDVRLIPSLQPPTPRSIRHRDIRWSTDDALAVSHLQLRSCPGINSQGGNIDTNWTASSVSNDSPLLLRARLFHFLLRPMLPGPNSTASVESRQ